MFYPVRIRSLPLLGSLSVLCFLGLLTPKLKRPFSNDKVSARPSDLPSSLEAPVQDPQWSKPTQTTNTFYFDADKIYNQKFKRGKKKHATKKNRMKQKNKFREKVVSVEVRNNASLLFFNRVPKTGSEMLVLLIQWLEGYNNFKHIRLRNSNTRRLDPFAQAALVNEIMDLKKTHTGLISVDRHVYFVNFSAYGGDFPTYINMIRDPLEKAVSRFYYHRVTPRPGDMRTPSMNEKQQYESGSSQYSLFSNCVQASDPECLFLSGEPYDLTIPYFCGHEYECMLLDSKWALQEAKKNVEEYYPVVGVLESLNASLAVLETVLPQYFTGIQDMYYEELLAPHINKNVQRPGEKLPEWLKSQIRDALKLEYDFYNFIWQRIHQQYDIIKDRGG